jgi:hypothetical protein
MKPLIHAGAVAIVVFAVAASAVFFMRSCAQIPLDEAGRAVELGDKAAHKAVDLAGRIVDGLERRLNLRPEVRIDSKTEVVVDHTGLKLVTLQREFTHEFLWEQEWLHSTKTIRLKGRFTASAGFDIGESLRLDINSDDLSVDLTLPEPRLLSCELVSYTAEEDDGWWNKITAEERHRAVNELVADARRKMEQDGELPREARRQLEAQVAGIITESGGTPGLSNGVPLGNRPPL